VVISLSAVLLLAIVLVVMIRSKSVKVGPRSWQPLRVLSSPRRIASVASDPRHDTEVAARRESDAPTPRGRPPGPISPARRRQRRSVRRRPDRGTGASSWDTQAAPAGSTQTTRASPAACRQSARPGGVRSGPAQFVPAQTGRRRPQRSPRRHRCNHPPGHAPPAATNGSGPRLRKHGRTVTDGPCRRGEEEPEEACHDRGPHLSRTAS